MSLLSKKLKELRGKLSQEEAAKGIGITPQTLGRYENDKRKPDSEVLIMISKYYKVSVDYLLGLSDFPLVNEKDIETACKVTGLSLRTVQHLAHEKEEYGNKEKTLQRLGLSPDDEELAGWGHFLEVRDKLFSSRYMEEIIYNCGVIFGESDHLLYTVGIQTDDINEICEKLCISKDALSDLLSKRFLNAGQFFDCVLEDSCDVSRYRVLKSIEKISDMFDKRREYLNYSAEELKEFLGVNDEMLKQLRDGINLQF